MEGLHEDQHISDLLYYGLGDPPATTSSLQLQKRSFGIVEAAASTPADDESRYDSEGCMTVDLLRQYQQVPFLEMVQQGAGGFQVLLRMQDEQLLRSALLAGMLQLQHGVVSAETDGGSSSTPPAQQPPRSSLELGSCVTHVSEELQSEVDCREQVVAPLTTASVSAAAAVDVRRRTKRVKKDAAIVKAEQWEEDVGVVGVKGEKEKKPVERKKRKRSRVCNNNKRAEEVESQRMSHIAVERNRRRLMNDHLAGLRELMPPSYIQRGDQASIVGGAIEFVKELEQHLQTLLAEKHTRANIRSSSCIQPPSPWASHRGPFDEFFVSPQYRASASSIHVDDIPADGSGTTTAAVADIEAAVTQTHVSLRLLAPRRPGQLLRVISTLQDMHLTVLHLNISSYDDYALYSLNLKIEDDCQLGSGDEVATAVHQIFSYIACTCAYA